MVLVWGFLVLVKTIAKYLIMSGSENVQIMKLGEIAVSDAVKKQNTNSLYQTTLWS